LLNPGVLPGTGIDDLIARVEWVGLTMISFKAFSSVFPITRLLVLVGR
jgi:hypothetical protein